MASCKPVIFKNVSRLKFRAVRARINAQADIEGSGESGLARGNGFTAAWTYCEPEQTLVIECTEKPFYVPESLVIAKIQALVESVNL
jgi:hypothetical protein